MLGVQKLMLHLFKFMFICPARKDAEYGHFSKAGTAMMHHENKPMQYTAIFHGR